MHSFALLANMKKQCSWQRIWELRKILKDKKTRVVKGKDGKIKGGVDFVDGSNLHHKYSKELADLEAKMAGAKESRPEKRKRLKYHSDGHNSWQKIFELRKILKDKKTIIVKTKDGKLWGGVDFVEGSDLYNKYSRELADLEAKMARAKESRNGHNKKQLVVKAVVCSDQMPIMNKVPLPATTVVKQEALLLVPPAVKQDAAMPVLPLLEKEEISTAADNWNDPEARPSWLDERTQMSRTEYLSYRTVITKECRDMFDYRVFLPHQAPNCGMSTTFGDLCDFLCEPLKHAHNVRDKRCLRSEELKPAHDVIEKQRGLVGSAELPIG